MIPRTAALPATRGPANRSTPRDRDRAGGRGPGVAGWQQSLAGAVATARELLEILEIDPRRVPGIDDGGDFPLLVPRSFVGRMRNGDPDDPLLRQVLPLVGEHRPVPGFTADPLAEAVASPAPGLLHKYRGRVLLLAAGACAVHCRYCFRRHFPYAEHRPWDWRPALDYIAADPGLEEVILSGGDPLAASDRKLARLAARLAAVPHLRRLRIHTRLPVVLPERVDDDLLGWLSGSPLQTVVVIHANHAQEIAAEVRAALGRLTAAGVTLLNQSVLLRGVNDRVETLADLSRALFEAGVLPYYLHLLDHVQGAAHFEVDEPAARDLVWKLVQRLPGYLVPRLVREVAGVPAKVPISLAAGDDTGGFGSGSDRVRSLR